MSKLTSDEVEFKIKKLIDLEKNLPKQIFSNLEKYNFYFEEPEAIYKVVFIAKLVKGKIFYSWCKD
ncbi:hypothetical protein HCA24_10050 [Listeria innocua]|uniref:hypothetical protein n=1 Tax=Listeria innocua TaxID=1642 RepID=UPI00164E0136|nr:hypothetical protein [Listeria innocua]MBC6149220.1 hypothetical protein [Listeria innocua]UPH48048.1 hypothetical protein AB348_10640 [Listeria innocua]